MANLPAGGIILRIPSAFTATQIADIIRRNDLDRYARCDIPQFGDDRWQNEH